MASLETKDHKGNIEMPFRVIVTSNVRILPILSKTTPDVRGSIAMHASKQATMPAEVELKEPRELVTAGKKQGSA